MRAGLGVGLFLAVASACALNWGFFTQQGVAAGLPPLTARRPLRSLRSLFASRRWLAGFLVGLGGWALYVAALALAPLSLVQATSAGGIGVLALLVSRVGGVRLGSRDRIGVWASVGGLCLLGVSLAGASPGGHAGPWLAVVVWIGGSLLTAACFAGPLAPLLAGGAGLGVAAGLLYAGGDVATKAAVGGGARLAFVPAVLALHGLAFVALQFAFQRGGALATAGVATLFTNAVPIVAGAALFAEGLPGGALGAARVLAFVAVVLGAGALAARKASAPERRAQMRFRSARLLKQRLHGV